MTLIAQTKSFWLPDADALSHLAPMWVLIGTIVAILIGAMIVGRGAKAIAGIALVGAILTVVSCYRVLLEVQTGSWSGLSPNDHAPMFLADNFSLFFSLLVSVFLA